MAHDTSIQFGEAPPLFAKPPGWSEAAVAAAEAKAAQPSHGHSHSHSRGSGTDTLQQQQLDEEVFQQNPMIRCLRMSVNQFT